MKKQIKVGSKLTLIKVNSLAMTSISEITVDSIVDERFFFTHKRRKYYLRMDNTTLVLKGHNLGITHGSFEYGNGHILMSSNCNLGGLNREDMIAMLKTNINPLFDQWRKIYWFDGTSEEGDPIFVPRPVSDNYLRYKEQAEENLNKTAEQIMVGDFIYNYQKSSKYNNLDDMLREHLTFHKDINETLQLGKVVAIEDISEEEFDSREYLDYELSDKGGSCSDDVEQERFDSYDLSEFERETVYSLLTLIRTPSGRAITADAQGYSYMRYTGLLPHYKTSMAADCERVQEILRVEKEKRIRAAEERKAEEARQLEAEKVRVEKEYPFLTALTKGDDYQKIGASNLRALLKHEFPATKFSVRKSSYKHYNVAWTDGPSDEKVSVITNMFKDEGFDGMTDYSYSIESPFMDRYGSLGYVFTERTISDERKNEELALLNVELGTTYEMNDYVTERLEMAHTLVFRRTRKKDYSPIVELKEPEQSTSTISSHGLEIIDYSARSFAVIGETKPIKKLLSDLGGSYNGRLRCGAGWIFSKTKLDMVKKALSIE